jgi:hypothetical protein
MLEVLNDDGLRALENSRIKGVASVRTGRSALVAEQQALPHRPRSFDGFHVRTSIERDQAQTEFRAAEEIPDTMLEPIDLLG